jgi:hypothetical protein
MEVRSLKDVFILLVLGSWPCLLAQLIPIGFCIGGYFYYRRRQVAEPEQSQERTDPAGR